MDQEKIVSADDLYALLIKAGEEQMEDTGIQDFLLGRSYVTGDIESTLNICYCVIGFLEMVVPNISNDIDMGLSFNHVRTDPVQCMGVVLDNGKAGFGFYTAGMAEAVRLKKEKAVRNGTSEAVAILSMAAYFIRNYLAKQKGIRLFKEGDQMFVSDSDLQLAIFNLTVNLSEIRADYEWEGRLDYLGSEVDAAIIGKYSEKKLGQGISPKELVGILLMEAPDPNTAKAQATIFFM